MPSGVGSFIKNLSLESSVTTVRPGSGSRVWCHKKVEVAAAAAPQKIHSNRYLLLADTTIPPSATSKEAQEDVFQFLVRAENAGVLRDTHISSPQMLELLEELERAAQAAIAQRQLLLVVDNEAEEDVVVPVVAHVVKIASYF